MWKDRRKRSGEERTYEKEGNVRQRKANVREKASVVGGKGSSER